MLNVDLWPFEAVEIRRSPDVQFTTAPIFIDNVSSCRVGDDRIPFFPCRLRFRAVDAISRFADGTGKGCGRGR